MSEVNIPLDDTTNRSSQRHTAGYFRDKSFQANNDTHMGTVNDNQTTNNKLSYSRAKWHIHCENYGSITFLFTNTVGGHVSRDNSTQ